MDDDPSFGRWLRQRRRSTDLTQAALAQCVGCTTNHLRAIEADRRRPSREISIRLADCLALAPTERTFFVDFARGQSARSRPAPVSSAVPLHAPTHVELSGADGAAARGNLPVRRDALLGRADDLAAVLALAQRAEVGLVTLAGPGGVGKTRLALAVGAALRDVFPDGVWFVDLASLRDPALVAAAIGAVLGVQDGGGLPLLARLQTFLRTRHLVLILDNFEHLVEAAPLLADLLSAAPRLTVLVTSRVVLGVYGEYVMAVPPLQIPNPARLPPFAELRQVAAVQLLLARTEAVGGSFALTPDNSAMVAELCQALEGLPLAIELAAARLRHLSLEQLHTRMRNRLSLLTGGARTLAPRQQTLRATLAWSYDLLDAGEQRLFRRLAVFAGRWSLEAAETVCDRAGDLPFAVVDGLASLVDKSLVDSEHVTSAEGGVQVPREVRFTMLETMREYALEQLAAQGEAEVVTMRQQHAAYFVALAERAAPELHGPQQQRWLNLLALEYGNLQAAVDWSLSQPGQAAGGLRLAAALGWYWIIRNRWSDGHIWLSRAEALSRTAGVDAMTRAAVVRAAGIMAVFRNAYAEAAVLLEESLRLARVANSRMGAAEAVVFLAWVARERGDYERAASYAAEGLQGYEAEDHRGGISLALLTLTEVFLDRGDLAQATTYGERLVTYCRAGGPMVHYARGLLRLGRIAYLRAEYAQGQNLQEECLALFRAQQAPSAVAEAQFELARIARAQGQLEDAAQLVQSSLIGYGQIWGNKRELAYCIEEVASLAMARGDGQRAARLLGAAAAVRATAGTPLPPVHQTAYTYERTALQEHLGVQAFAVAWAEGQAMTLEQAVAYALEQDPLTPEPPRLASTAGNSELAPMTEAAPSAGGHASLTGREREVLQLVAQGLRTGEVAAELGLSPLTVTVHLRAIYRKLGVRSRTAATRVALEQHLA